MRSYGTTCHTLLFDFKGGQWKPHVYAKWCYDIPGIYHVKRLRRVLMNDIALRPYMYSRYRDTLCDMYPLERLVMRYVEESFPDFEYDSNTRVYSFRGMTGVLPKRRIGRCFDLNKFLLSVTTNRTKLVE